MILEPSQLSSLKPFKEIFPKDLCRKISNKLNVYYSNPTYKRPKKYLIKGITQELQIGETAAYNLPGYVEFKEKEYDLIISKRLGGKSIPKKGFHLNTLEIQMPPAFKTEILDFDLGLPADKTNDSSLRMWKAARDVGIPPHLQKTSMYSVPLKFLSSKITKENFKRPKN